MGNKTTAIVGPGGADDPAALRAQIAETRQEMSGTLEELHGRLNPTVLKEQALESFHEATEKVKAELKVHFEEAKESIKTHLHEAKENLKSEVREATIGKVENMVHRTQDRVRDARESVVDVVRENPIPAALTGIGLAWLLLSSRRSRGSRRDMREMRSRDMGRQRQFAPRYEYDTQGYELDDSLVRYSSGYDGDHDGAGHADGQGNDRGVRARVGQRAQDAGRRIAGTAHDAREAVSHVAHDARDAVASAASGARDAVAGAAHRVGDTAVDLAHGARERAVHVARGARNQARRVQRRSSDMFRDNPLAVGAAMIAVGTVVGLALPRTDLEDQWMGPARDRVLDRAEEMAEEAVSKASEAVQHLGEKASGNGVDQQPQGSPSNGRLPAPRA